MLTARFPVRSGLTRRFAFSCVSHRQPTSRISRMPPKGHPPRSRTSFEDDAFRPEAAGVRGEQHGEEMFVLGDAIVGGGLSTAGLDARGFDATDGAGSSDEKIDAIGISTVGCIHADNSLWGPWKDCTFIRWSERFSASWRTHGFCQILGCVHSSPTGPAEYVKARHIVTISMASPIALGVALTISSRQSHTGAGGSGGRAPLTKQRGTHGV